MFSSRIHALVQTKTFDGRCTQTGFSRMLIQSCQPLVTSATVSWCLEKFAITLLRPRKQPKISPFRETMIRGRQLSGGPMTDPGPRQRGAVIVPACNEAALIERTLAPLSPAAVDGYIELIVV
jgi:hypothetical protein